ncbi:MULTISPECIES: outer membrane protein [Bartonella]|uniref:Porin n=3 Tax=Bartonella schoenbuchensis TaxID=165694 RepID=E6Z0I7_BARSR|nr:outer membrane protein [Bartonella capreoli]CBI82625.1 Hemin binding protein E [Bartonella schoenbuchensis R1]CDP80503.1 hemin binding protein E [Bartonella schoenbuchensis]
MNTKCLIATSIFTLAAISLVQAADSIVFKENYKMGVSPIVRPPTFSWNGFYIGGQVGGFSSKISAMSHDNDIPLLPDKSGRPKKWVPVNEKFLPKLSGFIGGFYAGSNVDLSNGLILSIDTDIILSARKNTNTIVITPPSTDDNMPEESNLIPNHENSQYRLSRRDVQLRENTIDIEEAEKTIITFKYTLNQKWTGATRIRIGFAADRIMPYIAGGVAYGQFQNILSLSSTATHDKELNNMSDETKTMIGYTFGAGIDFAMTDDIILRAEYRYSDFGKKKFAKDSFELHYKTNDFRAGVSYKF